MGGDSVSLQAEAAAMWQILVAARGLPDKALAIMCDSLGLLCMLKGFRKKDYMYHPDLYAHFDLVEKILEELNA